PDQPVPDGERRQQGARLHRDEGQLVHLRHLPGPRGLVPLAGAIMALHADPRLAQPRQLPPRIPLLQDAEIAPRIHSIVMPGLGPGIHELSSYPVMRGKLVDAKPKAWHDAVGSSQWSTAPGEPLRRWRRMARRARG